MFTLTTLFGFILATIAVESTPGPNMSYLAFLSASKGRKAGLMATAGTASGLLLIGLIAAFGMASLMTNNPLLYQVLRWGGVLYMFWLAFDTWTEKPTTGTPQVFTRFFRRGLIVNVLNPKAAIFYITVLPEFVDRSQALLFQTLALTFLYVGVATLVHLLIVLLASTAHALLQNQKWRKIVQRIFAILLVLIGLWLGWSTQLS